MKRVNIIGAGLAGTSIAYMLNKRGCEVSIYEASSRIAAGASGNDVGLYNPRFSAQKDVVGQYYSDAFFCGLKVFDAMGAAIDFNPCGALHLITDDRKARRYRKCIDSWGWDEQDLRIVDAAQASEIAGIVIEHEAMYSPRSGSLSPQKLCNEYARGIDVHLNHNVEYIDDLDGDVIILACGMGVLGFDAANYLPLRPVRGQVSYVVQNEVSGRLKTALCYNGYIAPSNGGVHCVGATFDRKNINDDCFDGDDLANLDSLKGEVGSMHSLCDIIKNKAGVRVSASDYFPVVGQLGRGGYISTGHGSHGILSTLKSACILADTLVGNADAHSRALLQALSPERFMF